MEEGLKTNRVVELLLSFRRSISRIGKFFFELVVCFYNLNREKREQITERSKVRSSISVPVPSVSLTLSRLADEKKIRQKGKISWSLTPKQSFIYIKKERRSSAFLLL